MPEGELTEPPPPIADNNPFLQQEDYFDDGATDSLVAGLTDEDKIYLRLKWGKAYKPEEWIELERLYTEMMESYDIPLAGDKNTNSACAKLFEAAWICDIRFEEGKNIHEDGFFVFQSYLKKPVLVQHNVFVYQYNLRDNSNSRQFFSDKYLSMLYFCEKKKELVFARCPQYEKEALNMEARVCLQVLELLCSTVDRKYKSLQKECVKNVRKLRAYHKPINQHYKQLEWIVTHGLFQVYKNLVRRKYYH